MSSENRAFCCGGWHPSEDVWRRHQVQSVTRRVKVPSTQCLCPLKKHWCALCSLSKFDEFWILNSCCCRKLQSAIRSLIKKRIGSVTSACVRESSHCSELTVEGWRNLLKLDFHTISPLTFRQLPFRSTLISPHPEAFLGKDLKALLQTGYLWTFSDCQSCFCSRFFESDVLRRSFFSIVVLTVLVWMQWIVLSKSSAVSFVELGKQKGRLSCCTRGVRTRCFARYVSRDAEKLHWQNYMWRQMSVIRYAESCS